MSKSAIHDLLLKKDDEIKRLRDLLRDIGDYLDPQDELDASFIKRIRTMLEAAK